VLSIHELSDDSVAEAPAPARPARGKAAAVKSRGGKAGGSTSARKPRSRKPPQPAIELSDSADEASDGEEMDMDEVDVSAAGPSGAVAEPEEEEMEMEMEEVPLDGGEGEADYSAAYAVAEAARQPENGDGAAATPAIFHDGKGQAAGVISLNLGGGSAAAGGSKAKRAQNENRLTPRDRAVRLASHKLGTLAMLAHAKVRNSWANDDPLKVGAGLAWCGCSSVLTRAGRTRCTTVSRRHCAPSSSLSIPSASPTCASECACLRPSCVTSSSGGRTAASALSRT
jgi:hypothetical protein